jgi:hypothetical protein
MNHKLSRTILITAAMPYFSPIFPKEIYECKIHDLVGPNSHDDPQ